MTWVIAVSNQKGGVGKTTSVVNLASALALRHGLRVLAVDMDPQGHLALSLGIDAGEPSRTITAALLGVHDLGQVVREVGLIRGLYVAPSNESLAAAEDRIARQPGREAVLATVLEPELPKYDVVLVDTPPSLGVLTFNALYASTHILVPVQPRLYSIEGLRRLYQIIHLMSKRLGRKVEILGHFLTMVDNRYRVTREVRSDLRARLGEGLLKTEIPMSVKAEEGHFHRIPLIVYAPDTEAARAYEALAGEVLSRLRGEVIRGESLESGVGLDGGEH
ncbi:Sporulation initiation inhibitor protein Soj [Candidatus Calditenuaceae archaeon HR02]|nr:Sporulation initiation inhibitor protein Soj [Candidatus Calditenuaceae archaeon HR02]